MNYIKSDNINQNKTKPYEEKSYGCMHTLGTAVGTIGGLLTAIVLSSTKNNASVKETHQTPIIKSTQKIDNYQKITLEKRVVK